MSKRKAYRPKYSLHEQMQASRRALFTRSKEQVFKETADMILTALDGSWRHLRAGNATDDDYNALTTAANLCIVLCERGVGAEWRDVVSRAMRAMQEVRDRHTKIGRYVATGEALTLIREMIDVRYAQLTADGYHAGLEYQAAEIVADRCARKHFIKVAA